MGSCGGFYISCFSSARAIRNAIRAAANESLVRQVNSQIVDVLTATPLSLMAKPGSGHGIRGVLERMRERLHHGRDAHQPKRSEPHPGTISQREVLTGKRESPSPPKTEPIISEALRSEAAN